MYKFFKKLDFLIICSILFAILSCKQLLNGGAIALDAYDYSIITPPELGISGNSLGSSYYRGVFVKNRIVKLESYCLCKSEVTYELWKDVFAWAEKNGYTFKFSGQKGGNGNGAVTEPVTGVTWIDCVVWCNAYTEKTKTVNDCVYYKSETDKTVLRNAKDDTVWDSIYFDRSKTGFRLPTEAEWEYAARYTSSSSNAVKTGDIYLTNLNSASGAAAVCSNEEETIKVAWYKPSALYKKVRTHNVATKKPNDLGIYDMSGNVWEWCFDRYDDLTRFDSSSTITEQDPIGPLSGKKRVARGGGWHCPPLLICVGSRRDEDLDKTAANNTWGFRLAKNND